MQRREFAKTLALAGVAALAGPGAGSAQPADSLTALSEAQAGILRTLYGKHLSEEQLKRIQGRVRGNLASAAQLQKMPLANGDEPAFVFILD